MIACQRHLFDIPDDVTYLNCAYMSPLMRAAAEAGKTGLNRKLRPWEISADDFFDQSDELRGLAAKLFGCQGNDVAIIPSASFGVQTAALNLPVAAGQKILVLEEQFPSNFYPWQRLAIERGAELVTVRWPSDGDWTSAVLSELTEDTAIAALPQTHWSSGGLLDLTRISTACRHAGTALALDLTQSLGAYPFHVNAVQPDFAVAAAYKWLMGPYSIGVMYVAPKWQQGRPLEESWMQRENARDFAGLVLYTDAYQPGAQRFDVGERSNFALAPAAISAMEQLLKWGVEEISSTVGALNRRLAAGAAQFGIEGVVSDKFRARHYLCLRCEDAASLARRLAQHRVYVSARGSSVRVTPHVYNSEADVEKLLAVLESEK